MCKAHDALTIVFLLHKGKLESFEQDNRGRLLLADLIGRRVSPTDEILEVSWKTTLRPVVEKLRKLVPEYVLEDMRKGPLNTKRWSQHILDTFREAIFDRLRPCTFERFGQADGYIKSYYDPIRAAYPTWRQPTTTCMHKINYLHHQDFEHPIPYQPIRLALAKRLQRLIPEAGFALTEITDQNSTHILYEIGIFLNIRAGDQLHTYGDIHESRNTARYLEDRRRGMISESEAEGSSGEESAISHDPDTPADDADPETWNLYWRTLRSS
jgi:hypothetical protein